MKPIRPWKDVVTEWAPELSAKLGRSVEAILTDGLNANDFSPSSFVEVRDPSGWTMKFSFAFAVVRPAMKQAAVFTEHSGYVEFDLVEDSVVAEINEEIYRQK